GPPVRFLHGQRILEAGGNAFDAALGALCAATVCEPLLTSLAGGGFLLARPAGSEPQLFDFFVQTPRHKRAEAELDFYPIVADFGTAVQEFHVGWGSAAVPGVVAGLFEAHEALGVLPLGEVVAPAVALAREGVEVTTYQARLSRVLRPILDVSKGAMGLVAPAGPERHRPARAGERAVHPEMADTLEALAREGRRWFYEGEPAQRLVEACRTRGGQLTAGDLRDYPVCRRRPVHCRAFDADFWFNAPPSPGGSLVAFSLALLEPLGMEAAAWGEPESRLAVVRAMAAANRLRAVTQREALDDALASEWLSDECLAEWRAHALPDQCFTRGTTHLSVADEQGNLASLTSSNGEGCGHVVPGTGVMLNNMLGEEDLNPDGFHRWQPDARLASMMCPTIARLPDGSEVALGTGGANRIRGAVLQVLLNLCAFRMPIADAVTAPRMHLEGDTLSVETGLTPEALARLVANWPDNAQWPEPHLFFGGVHAAERLADGSFRGAGDPRRDGVVALSE
ncbi:MAG: gamma-glutamyltransferase, partial [Pseudomonadota bacterium]